MFYYLKGKIGVTAMTKSEGDGVLGEWVSPTPTVVNHVDIEQKMKFRFSIFFSCFL